MFSGLMMIAMNAALRRTIGGEGLRVTFLTEPEAALERLRDPEQQPDVIIADLIMRTNPEESVGDAHVSGLRLCKRIRQELKIKAPIIILSVVTDLKLSERLRRSPLQ